MNFLISLNKVGMFFSGVLKLFIYKEVLNINTSEDEIKLPPKSKLVYSYKTTGLIETETSLELCNFKNQEERNCFV